MAQSIKKQVEQAVRAEKRLTNAVYALAPNDNTPFNDCMKLASTDLKAKCYAAMLKRITLEMEAVSAGKAWRGSFGMLVWYR